MKTLEEEPDTLEGYVIKLIKDNWHHIVPHRLMIIALTVGVLLSLIITFLGSR